MGGASVGAAVRFSFQTRPNARPPLLPIRERGETKRVSRGSRGSEVPMWWPWPRGPGFSEGSAPRPPCFLTEDPRPGITVTAPHRPVTWSGRRVTAQLGFVCTAAAPVPPTSRARSPHIPSTASVSCRRLPRCPPGSCWGSGSRPPRGKSGLWGRTAGPRERGPRAQAGRPRGGGAVLLPTGSVPQLGWPDGQPTSFLRASRVSRGRRWAWVKGQSPDTLLNPKSFSKLPS